MVLVPRGKPVKENLATEGLKFAETLGKLQSSHFNGYLRIKASGGCGILLFCAGRLACALFERPAQQRFVGFDALARIFEEMQRQETRLDVYRLSPDLAEDIHALLLGHSLYEGQVVRLLNVRKLLDELAAQNFDGCLRVRADGQAALIFFTCGRARGFHHDGSGEVETRADVSASLARLHDARVDVVARSDEESATPSDLLEGGQWRMLWERAARLRH